MAGIVALGVGVASAVGSAINTGNANAQAQQVQQQETQLLNEAQQQQEQQKEQATLINQRTGQENALNPNTNKFTADNTIKTSPLGLPPAANSAKPAQLLGT